MKTTANIEMKRMTISFSIITPSYLMARLGKAIVDSRFAFQLSALISFLLNEKISPAKSICLLNVFAATLSAFLFGGYSLGVQLVLILWFIIALWQCIRSK